MSVISCRLLWTGGQGSKERRKRAHILVLADWDRAGGGRRDADIADILGVGMATVERVRKPCVEAGLERKVQVNRKQRVLDGAGEAKLTMLACSEPPAGQARWTLRLLADKLVELNIVETISRSTVQTTLKKTISSPGSISVDAFRPGRMLISSARWRMFLRRIAGTLPLMRFGSAWMKPPGNKRKKPAHRFPPSLQKSSCLAQVPRSWQSRTKCVRKPLTKRTTVRGYPSVPSTPTQRQRLLEYLETHAPARARELEDVSVSAATISRAVRSGDILRLGRGLYGLPDSVPDTHETLIEVAKRVPKAVICLTSALAYHGLTDQLPRRVWIAIGAKDWKPKIIYPKIRTVRFREPYFSGGVEEHKIGVATIMMYTTPKTLADTFRSQRLVDRSVAIEALKAAIEQRKVTPSAIAEAARNYGAWNQMRPYLEAVASNG